MNFGIISLNIQYMNFNAQFAFISKESRDYNIFIIIIFYVIFR